MITTMIALVCWNVFLTAALVGLSLRQNEIVKQVNHLHIENLRQGLGLQDNDPNPRG